MPAAKKVRNRRKSPVSNGKFVGYVIPQKLLWGCSQGGPYRVAADKRRKGDK